MACSKTVEITNETGLHTRPGNEFVSLAKTFTSAVEVENEEGKRVIGIKKGAKVTVHAEGADETEAVEKLAELLANLKD